MGEDQPGDVELARTEPGHLPVEDRDRLEVAVHRVADPGIAPAGHAVRRRGQVGLEPRERPLDEWGPGQVRGGPLVPPTRLGETAREQGVAGRIRNEEGEGPLVVRDRVQPGQHLDRPVLQALLLLGRGVEEPVVPEVVGQHVRGHDPLDPVHQEERRADHPTCRLEPPHSGDRDVGELADEPHHVVLGLQVVRLENGNVVGTRSHAGDVLTEVLLTVLGPGDVENDRLRRHAIGVDARVEPHLRRRTVRQLRGEPLLQTLLERCHVAAGALHREIGGWWRLAHVGPPRSAPHTLR